MIQRRDAALLPNYFGQTCYYYYYIDDKSIEEMMLTVEIN